MKFLAIAGAAAALLATPAAALTVLQTSSVANANTGVTTALTFDQFDTTLGTLDSVVLSFEAAMPTVSGTLQNGSNVSRTFTLSYGTTAGVTGNGFDLSSALGAGTQDVETNRRQTVDIGPFSGSGSDSDTLTGDLSAFIGLGDVNFNFTRNSLFAITPNSGTLSITPQIGGNVSLTYNYTPASAAVPEPAAWALMIMGFGGAGAALRNRRKLAFAA